MKEEVLRIEDLWVRYSNRQSYALKGVSLSLRRGEILGILGPSGSGKSTLLKAVAGIVPVERGAIYLNGEEVTRIPPNKRNLGIVFQSFALFPHMTAKENIAYGLKLRRVPSGEREKKVRDLLKLVGLEGFEDRYPSQLSGGQQQRVALARAMAIDPPIILMDEPMSNIDPIFRSRLRQEVRKLLKEKNISSLYVTHDRDDAFEISDRIAVLRDGVLEQVGRPEELVMRPRSKFVAEFMGLDNIIELKCSNICREEGEAISINTESYFIVLPKPAFNSEAITFGISKQKMKIEEERPKNPSWMLGKVSDVTFMGSGYNILLETELGEIRVFSQSIENISPGKILYISFSSKDIVPLGD